MKKFLLKIILFSILSAAGLSLILIKYGAYVDYFYEKFTVPEQSSMILGDSRSMQGIQPQIINHELKDSGYALPMFNYSFTVAQINYGKPLTESVKRKLKSTKNGLFILTVNPWLFTEREGDDLKNGIYSEKNVPPNNMHFVNVNPNFEYFIRNFRYFHFRTIIRQTAKLHKDGWMEESNLPKDEQTLSEWKDQQVVLYNDFSKKWKISFQRIKDMEDLIGFLQSNGRVIVVRMPVDKKILMVENDFWQNFDQEMNFVALRNKVKYFNFSKSNKYQTYDGNHIDKYGGVVFTKELCDSIRATN